MTAALSEGLQPRPRRANSVHKDGLLQGCSQEEGDRDVKFVNTYRCLHLFIHTLYFNVERIKDTIQYCGFQNCVLLSLSGD